MTTDDSQKPYAGFNFLLEIDEITWAAFSECSGLSTNRGFIDYREDIADSTIRKIPRHTKFFTITLKRGMTRDMGLWNWTKTVLDGATEKKSGSIVLLNDLGKQAMRWSFKAGWPIKWEGPSLNANGKNVAVETLEIAVEGLELGHGNES